MAADIGSGGGQRRRLAAGGAWSFGRRSEQTGLGRNKLLSSMAGVVRSIETCLEVDLSLDGKGFRRQWLGFRRQEAAAGDNRLSPAQPAAGRRQAAGGGYGFITENSGSDTM